MTWFKVDDKFAGHPKVEAVIYDEEPEHAALAITAWTLAGSNSADQLTDGFIPKRTLRRLGGPLNLVLGAEALVRAGLWHEVEGGFQFHDWSDHQPMREQVLAKRKRDADRKAAARSGGRKRTKRGVRDESTRTGSTPSAVTPGGQNAESIADSPDVRADAESVRADKTRSPRPPTRPDPTRPDQGGGARAGDPPVHPEPATDPPPPKPRARPKSVDYAAYHRDHPLVAAALSSLSEAAQAAGGTPRVWGPYGSQQALAQVAKSAEDIARQTGDDPAELVEAAARGFIAERGTKARTEWWPENFERYLEAGKKAPDPQVAQLEREYHQLRKAAHEAPDHDTSDRLDAEAHEVGQKLAKLKMAAGGAR